MSFLIDAAIKSIFSAEPNNNWEYVVQHMFEDDNVPAPHAKPFSNMRDAMTYMVALWNEPRTLVHISVTRRNA